MFRLIRWWTETTWTGLKCVMGYHAMEWYFSASYTQYRCKHCFHIEKPIILHKKRSQKDI